MDSGGSRHAAGQEPSPAGDGSSWLSFGALRRPHGTRGEIMLAPFNDAADRDWTKSLPVHVRWVKGDRVLELDIVTLRHVKDGFLVRFASPDTRETLAPLVGGEIQLARQGLPALAGDEFYVDDVVGWQVVLLDGQRLGQVSGTYWNGGHNVMVIVAEGAAPNEERFLPILPGFVLSFDAAARCLTVDLHE